MLNKQTLLPYPFAELRFDNCYNQRCCVGVKNILHSRTDYGIFIAQKACIRWYVHPAKPKMLLTSIKETCLSILIHPSK
jgi:hypothetical protein